LKKTEQRVPNTPRGEQPQDEHELGGEDHRSLEHAADCEERSHGNQIIGAGGTLSVLQDHPAAKQSSHQEDTREGMNEPQWSENGSEEFSQHHPGVRKCRADRIPPPSVEVYLKS
jgi:hypothetical protein